MEYLVSLSQSGIATPLVPGGLTIYAIGDIHGRSDLLAQTHELIDKDKGKSKCERNAEVYLGDYIDRGPDSSAVISRLIKRSSETCTIFVRGNHEQLLLDFIHGKDCWPEWKAVGCITSCLSYGISPNFLFDDVTAEAVRQALNECIPPEHIRFYSDTCSYCRIGPYLFVH